MIEHLNNRTGLMKDNGLALRVLEALQDIAHDQWASDKVPLILSAGTQPKKRSNP